MQPGDQEIVVPLLKQRLLEHRRVGLEVAVEPPAEGVAVDVGEEAVVEVCGVVGFGGRGAEVSGLGGAGGWRALDEVGEGGGEEVRLGGERGGVGGPSGGGGVVV